MRTYGRVTDEYGKTTWKVVTTDAAGFNDYVWVTTLIQCLKLNLGESPFWANYGIPAHASIVQQIYPDYYVTLTQQQFAPHFASLLLSKVPNQGKPVYRINATTNQGVKVAADIPT